MRIESTGRAMPPPFAMGVEALCAAKEPGGWATREVGSAELARVAGEEAVDDEVLRRDDALGRLVSRAFDGGIARLVLGELGIGGE